MKIFWLSMPKKHNYGIIRDSINRSEAKNIAFSFEFYDTSCENKYCLSKWEKDQVALALARLKDINNKTYNEISKDAKGYHFNQVDWDKTNKKEGFPDVRLKNLPPFHFSLVGINNQKARVFGAYSENVFYIVWFDFNHEIWPSYKKYT